MRAAVRVERNSFRFLGMGSKPDCGRKQREWSAEFIPLQPPDGRGFEHGMKRLELPRRSGMNSALHWLAPDLPGASKQFASSSRSMGGAS